jgi:TfoX/Sxy family transcriptional regulator of competence genes
MKSSPTASQTMDHLADRVRTILGEDPRITEKNMFGGLTFLFNGHILVGCKKDGRILLSVGKAHNAEAMARPGATQMHHNGRDMIGFVWVEPDAIEDEDDLGDWVKLAERCVRQMPPKAAAEPKKRSPMAGKAVPARKIAAKASRASR